MFMNPAPLDIQGTLKVEIRLERVGHCRPADVMIALANMSKRLSCRPSKERLVNSLRMAIPKTVILPRRVDAVIQARRVSGRKRACERTTLVSICGTDHS